MKNMTFLALEKHYGLSHESFFVMVRYKNHQTRVSSGSSAATHIKLYVLTCAVVFNQRDLLKYTDLLIYSQ